MFSQELRKRVTEITTEMHELFYKGYTPKVKPTPACQACSLVELCLPKLCKQPSVADYMKAHLQGDLP